MGNQDLERVKSGYMGMLREIQCVCMFLKSYCSVKAEATILHVLI